MPKNPKTRMYEFTYTPIEIYKREKSYKLKDGSTRKRTYYEARSFVKTDVASSLVTGSGSTRQEAKNALLEKLNTEERKHLTDVSVPESTLTEALLNFAEYKKAEGNWRGTTYNRYVEIIEQQISTYLLGMKPPLEVTHDDILRHIQELRDYSFTESTVKKTYSLLHVYYSFVYKNNPNANPCYNITINYHPTVTKDDVLTSDEAVKFFDACDCLGGNADILKMQFLTYTRPGEIRSLKFSDWHQKENFLYINRTITQDYNGNVIVGPEGVAKTPTSIRNFPLTEMENKILQARYDKAVNIVGDNIGDTYIWSSPRDPYKPLSYSAQRRIMQKALAIAGIEKDISLHKLRHSGISFYGKDPKQLIVVSKNAGHKNLSTTTDLYKHVLDEDQLKAVKDANTKNSIFAHRKPKKVFRLKSPYKN